MKNGRCWLGRRVVALCVLGFIALAGADCAFAEAHVKHGTVERIKVHGKSLEGNLEGDSPDREVSVYLPPSYVTDQQRRYPVVYLLHGFTDTDLKWFGHEETFIHGAAAADRAFSSGTREMILVMPNAKTRYFGSGYSNSVTTGDWEDFIAHELVGYIDAHYRTIADRMSRGLAGHSFGGYGTIRLGLKYPEVFSSIYGLSACCLTPLADPKKPELKKMESVRTDADILNADFFTKANLASAAAWSPNPANPPNYIDLPWKGGVFQNSVADRWAANAPNVMIHQYIPNVRSLHAIAFDVGDQDSLKTGAAELDKILKDYGIAHTFEIYQGDHLNRIEVRFEKYVLPFFGKNLKF
jgi:enterochelin esterase-like enzyme